MSEILLDSMTVKLYLHVMNFAEFPRLDRYSEGFRAGRAANPFAVVSLPAPVYGEILAGIIGMPLAARDAIRTHLATLSVHAFDHIAAESLAESFELMMGVKPALEFARRFKKEKQLFKVDMQIIAIARRKTLPLMSADQFVLKACERCGVEAIDPYALPGAV